MRLKGVLSFVILASTILAPFGSSAHDNLVGHPRDSMDHEIPMPASSDTPAEDPSFRTNWKAFFSGEPEIPEPNNNLLDFLKVRIDCRGPALQMSKYVQSYGDAGSQALESDGKSVSKNIQKLLKKMAIQVPQCFDSVARTYAVASLQLLGRKNFASSQHWWRDVDTAELPQILLGAFLSNEGRLQFLSSEWKSESPENSKIRGAYSCAHQTIYLDLSLPPLNLAATFVHEMDHLFRDLDYSGDQIKKDFLTAGVNDQAGWDAFILMDESLAIVASSFDERALQADTGEVLADRILYSKIETLTPFKFKSDQSVFSPGGALDKLFSSCKQWSTYATEQQLPDFLQKTFLQQNATTLCGNVADEAVDRNDIYRVIYDGYFSGAGAIGTDLASRLDPRLHSPDLDPLSTWIWNHMIIQHFLQYSSFANGRYSICDGNPSIQCDSFNLEPFVAALAELHAKLGTVSSACQLYMSAGVPLLGPYIGNQIGGKPSGDGVRPSGDGVRPSGDGARPSGDGVRPELDGLRPCYDLHDEI